MTKKSVMPAQAGNHVHHLVYYEIHSDVYEAITREQRIKKSNRQWKINRIEQTNPQWIDLGIRLF